jgi:hypothetical protein
MECAQIEITGGTGSVKPKTYSIPGVYKVGAPKTYYASISANNRVKSNDPGLLIDNYSMKPTSKYVIPGETPALTTIYPQLTTSRSADVHLCVECANYGIMPQMSTQRNVVSTRSVHLATWNFAK